MINNKMINYDTVERIEANVKWYNPAKGYGFLYQEGKTGDIMIHFSLLDAIKCPYIKLGDTVICEVAHGKSGLQAVRVIDVKYGSPEPRSISGFFTSKLPPLDPESLEEIEGILKWYNPNKGYGFICPDDGTREIFMHFSVLREAGYTFLEPGARILVKVAQSERGPEARMIRVLHKEKQEVG
jgi:cold shock protein